VNRNLLPRANAGGCEAYILLEVMLATAIFALVVVALAVALNETMDAGARLQQETGIVWSLESKLAEARISRLAPGREVSKPDASGIVYEKEVSPLNCKNKKNQFLNGLYNIRITARWKENNQDREQYSQIYVYQP
jgi:type II secretion system protein I